MGIFSKIFGTDSAIQSGLDMIANAGDAIVFTDEEKAQQKVTLLKAYEPFKLIQRFIVMVFCVPYVSLHVVVIVGQLLGMNWGDISIMINDAFGYPVLAAVGLYLTGGVIPSRK